MGFTPQPPGSIRSPVDPPAADFEALQQRLFPEPPRPRWYERLNLWRGLALGSSVLASVLAVVLLANLHLQEPGYVLMLSSTQTHQPAWLINASHNMDQLYVQSLKVLDMPKNVRCMLWLRPDGSDQFYPLGVLPDKGDEMMLDVARDKRPMMPGQLLVTMEDVSGAMPETEYAPDVRGQVDAAQGVIARSRSLNGPAWVGQRPVFRLDGLMLR